MGQYLVIGIATRIAADKKEAAWKFKSIEEFKIHFERRFNAKGIYQLKENESYSWYELRPEIAEKEWVDFIKDFYEIRYPEPVEEDYILEILSQEKGFEEWIHLAKRREYQSYQMTCLSDHVEDQKNDRYLTVYMDFVTLSMDGKAWMECYNELFDFFTHLIRKKLSKYQLSESLFVEITD